MLGLATHEPHFSLLREEVRFTGKASQKRSTAPEETTFHLLHLSLMREYLDFEFGNELKVDYKFISYVVNEGKSGSWVQMLRWDIPISMNMEFSFVLLSTVHSYL